MNPTAAVKVMMNSIVDCPFSLLAAIRIRPPEKPAAVFLVIEISVVLIGAIIEVHGIVIVYAIVELSAVTIRVLHPLPDSFKQPSLALDELLKHGIVIKRVTN
jgi:hypothetical protein